MQVRYQAALLPVANRIAQAQRAYNAEGVAEHVTVRHMSRSGRCTQGLAFVWEYRSMAEGAHLCRLPVQPGPSLVGVHGVADPGQRDALAVHTSFDGPLGLMHLC